MSKSQCTAAPVLLATPLTLHLNIVLSFSLCVATFIVSVVKKKPPSPSNMPQDPAGLMTTKLSGVYIAVRKMSSYSSMVVNLLHSAQLLQGIFDVTIIDDLMQRRLDGD